MVVILLAFVEFCVGRPFPSWLYLGVALLACTPLLMRYRLKHLPIRLILCSLVFMVAANYSKHGLGSRKPFLQTLFSIEVGMSEAEVDQVMTGYIKLTEVTQRSSNLGSRPSNGFTGTRLYRRPPQGPANDADRGVVHFRDGRVTYVDFSGD